MKYLLLFFCFFCQQAVARCDANNEQCAPVGQWQFSMAIGVGVHTNPLNGGDNVPLILVPSISYYGEHAFFDNGVLGYSWIDGSQWVVSAITELNHEKAYFSRWHPQNIFIENASNAFENDVKEVVDIEQVDERKWALDAGIQVNWFISPSTDVIVKLLHDVSRVYQGYNAKISLHHTLAIPYFSETFLKLGVGAQFNNAKLVDYYYGVNQQDDLHTQVIFAGRSSINPIINIELSKAINQQWRLSFYWKRKLLDANTSNSPLVKERQIDTLFLGMEYAF